MKLKYNVRLLVEYQIEANSFNDALMQASINVMPNNNDAVKWHYVGKNEKRYQINYENMSLTEVDTFGPAVAPLTVVREFDPDQQIWS